MGQRTHGPSTRVAVGVSRSSLLKGRHKRVSSRNGRCSCTEQRRRLTQAFQSPTPIPSLRSLKRLMRTGRKCKRAKGLKEKPEKKNIGMRSLEKLAPKAKLELLSCKIQSRKKHIFCRLKPRKSDFQNPPSKSQSMQIRVSFGILLYFLSLQLSSIIYFYISAACVFYLN